MPIARTLDAGVAVLTLELGRGNAIGYPFMEALAAALDGALADGALAVVLTATGKVFCGGLDLVTIHDFDRAEMGRFVDAFEATFRRVLTFPRPVVAAINGHALAGGCILAMAADHRVVEAGAAQIGVNEVAIGIPFPAAPFEIARRATPERSAGAVLLEGRRFSPAAALAAGIVDEVAEGCLGAAIAQARRFAAGGAEAVADTKADLVAPVLARIDATTAVKRERFLDRWFAADARARIGAVRDQLVKPRP